MLFQIKRKETKMTIGKAQSTKHSNLSRLTSIKTNFCYVLIIDNNHNEKIKIWAKTDIYNITFFCTTCR